jgi:hypothetical protein
MMVVPVAVEGGKIGKPLASTVIVKGAVEMIGLLMPFRTVQLIRSKDSA